MTIHERMVEMARGRKELQVCDFCHALLPHNDRWTVTVEHHGDVISHYTICRKCYTVVFDFEEEL